jgi:hypothetical protein
MRSLHRGDAETRRNPEEKLTEAGANPDFPSPFNRHCASCSWRSLLGCRLGTRAETCCGSGSRSMRRLESRRGRLKSLRHKARRKAPLELQANSAPSASSASNSGITKRVLTFWRAFLSSSSASPRLGGEISAVFHSPTGFVKWRTALKRRRILCDLRPLCCPGNDEAASRFAFSLLGTFSVSLRLRVSAVNPALLSSAAAIARRRHDAF